jgi:hypothetical protein
VVVCTIAQAHEEIKPKKNTNIVNEILSAIDAEKK